MESKFLLILLFTISIPGSYSNLATLVTSSSFYAGGSGLNFLYQQGTQRLFSFTSSSSTTQLGNYDSGSSSLWITSYPCEYLAQGLFVNATNSVFCFGYADILKKKGVAIHQINPFNAAPFKSLKTYACPNCLSTGIIGSLDGVAIIPTGTSSYIVFNSQEGKLTCPFNFASSSENLMVATSVNSFVFIGGMTQNNAEYVLQTWSCSSNSVTNQQTINLSSYNSPFISDSINLYNESTLVTSVIILESGALFTVTDLNNNQNSPNPYLVPGVIPNGYWKISDEVFVLVSLDNNGNTILGVYNIGTNLFPFLASSFNLGYYPVSYIDTIPNSNVVIIYSSSEPNGDLEYIEINTFTWQVTNFYTGNPPLVFSNGSWVYYGNQGYYITNQNRTAITFVSLPVSGFLSYPTDYGLVYGVFTSNATTTASNTAYIVTFDSTASTITIQNLSNLPCPPSANARDVFILLDVTYSSFCNPCISYTADSELIVVTNNTAYETDFYGFIEVSLFGDYANGVVRGFILDGENSAIATYSYINSTQLNTVLTPLQAMSDIVINETLVFVPSLNGTQIIFYIYNIMTNQTVASFSGGADTIFQEGVNKGAALIGYDASLSTIFQGWVIPLVMEATKLQVVRVYDADGATQDFNFQTNPVLSGWTQTGFSSTSNGNGIIGYQSLFEFTTEL